MRNRKDNLSSASVLDPLNRGMQPHQGSLKAFSERVDGDQSVSPMAQLLLPCDVCKGCAGCDAVSIADQADTLLVSLPSTSRAEIYAQMLLWRVRCVRLVAGMGAGREPPGVALVFADSLSLAKRTASTKAASECFRQHMEALLLQAALDLLHDLMLHNPTNLRDGMELIREIHLSTDIIREEILDYSPKQQARWVAARPVCCYVSWQRLR